MLGLQAPDDRLELRLFASAPDIVTIDGNGVMSALRPGTALITAENQGLVADVMVEAADGAPSVSVTAPDTVAAGATFDVAASAIRRGGSGRCRPSEI